MELDLKSPIGLVAGNGDFPLQFVRNACARNLAVMVVAHRGETDPEIEKLASECLWVRVGELGKIVRFLESRGVEQASFVGGIRRARLFSGVRPDLTAIKLIARLRSVKDDVLLRGVAGELEARGIQVLGPGILLPDAVPGAGLLTRRGLNEVEKNDAQIGWEAARAIGALDIGQAVCVLEGVVTALEAVEGTDGLIRRAAALTGRAGVVVKLAKPHQDLRLDLPAVGPETIRLMAECRATALVLEAGRAMMLDPVRVVELADQAGIAIVAAGRPDELV